MNNFLKHNDWARDPAFNHFWRHYDFSNQWIKQHTDASRQVQMQMVQRDNLSTEQCFSDSEEPEVIERLSRCEIYSEIENEESDIEEMSEEMKAFFAKTQEHRQKLKEQRAAEKRKEGQSSSKSQEEYVNVDKISIRGRIEQSTDHRNASAEFIAKREKAKKDYGESATKILAMESTLAMKFESEYSQNPQLWPNIPFRF